MSKTAPTQSINKYLIEEIVKLSDRVAKCEQRCDLKSNYLTDYTGSELKNETQLKNLLQQLNGRVTAIENELRIINSDQSGFMTTAQMASHLGIGQSVLRRYALHPHRWPYLKDGKHHTRAPNRSYLFNPHLVIKALSNYEKCA